MKLKKKIIIFMLFLLIPAIFAAVTRNIPSWNCPSGFNVRLTDGGAVSSYGAEETLGQTWDIAGSSPTYTLKDPDSGDGIQQIGFFGISPAEQITYTLKIPAGSYSVFGYYVLDSSGQKPIGTTNFIVHENTCIAGTEDDLDSDGRGPGCACPNTDCCDSGTENSMGCTLDINIRKSIYKGAQEDNAAGENDGIDQDCNGCDFVDLDNDGYRLSGTGCGANDCNDNNIAINPGVAESPSLNCDGIDNDCSNGDCCPSTDEIDLTYYDQNCDGKVDNDKKNLFIQKFLAGIIDPALQLVIDNIPGSGYTNP